MKIKNKKSSLDTKQLKYSVHILKPDQTIQNFDFLMLNEFLKKTKKSSVSEVFLYDLFDYTDQVDNLELLKSIVAKLKPGGKIYIQGTDAKLLSSAYLYGQMDIVLYRSMLFGGYAGFDKKNIFTVSDIKNLISDIDNLKFSEIKYINAIQYYVECCKDE